MGNFMGASPTRSSKKLVSLEFLFFKHLGVNEML